EQKTGLRHHSIQLKRLLPYLCKNCRTRFGLCRRLVRTNTCPFRPRRPCFAERRSSAQESAGLHRVLVPSLSKTHSGDEKRPYNRDTPAHLSQFALIGFQGLM